jgi:hypothetical protein
MNAHALAACRVTLRQHMPSTVARQVVVDLQDGLTS